MLKKMIPIYIVLVVFGVLSDAKEPSCKQRRPTHCFHLELENIKFPDSEEALNEICQVLLPTLKCLVDFQNNCGSKYPESVDERLNTFYDVLVQACDKNSKLHQELSTHLPCIEEIHTAHQNACKPLVKDAVEEASRELSLVKDEDGYFEDREDMLKYYCLNEAIEVSCFVAYTSVKCGEDARDLVVKLLNRSGFMNDACPDEISGEIKEVVSVVLPLMEVELAAEEIISEIKSLN